MLKKIIFIVVVLVVIVGGLVGIKTMQIASMIEAGENFQMPPEAVSSAVAEKDKWPSSLTAVGTLSPAQGVMLSAELSGVVNSIHFESGQSVEKGDMLLELDVRADLAQLKAAQASLALEELRYDRAKELRAKQTIAQSELDAAEARYLEASAQVENIEAVVAKKRIVAPFSGRLGIRQVNLGQFVNNGEPIVSLQSLQPMYVDFALPQQRIDQLKEGMVVQLDVDAFPQRTFRGSLSAVAPEVDVVTRSVSLRATFANEDGALRSGMFAQVAVIQPQPKEVVKVPSTAILYAPYGNSVYIIEEGEMGSVARQAFVRIGETRGDFVSIVEGLEAGQSVVSAGAFKLRNGVGVLVNNETAPQPELEPMPEDS